MRISGKRIASVERILVSDGNINLLLSRVIPLRPFKRPPEKFAGLEYQSFEADKNQIGEADTFMSLASKPFRLTF
jgi:hypothetical protein